VLVLLQVAVKLYEPSLNELFIHKENTDVD